MAEPKLKETKPMKKIISLSIDENLLKKIDEARRLATRSRFIENILEDWDLWQIEPETENDEE